MDTPKVKTDIKILFVSEDEHEIKLACTAGIAYEIAITYVGVLRTTTLCDIYYFNYSPLMNVEEVVAWLLSFSSEEKPKE